MDHRLDTVLQWSADFRRPVRRLTVRRRPGCRTGRPPGRGGTVIGPHRAAGGADLAFQLVSNPSSVFRSYDLPAAPPPGRAGRRGDRGGQARRMPNSVASPVSPPGTPCSAGCGRRSDPPRPAPIQQGPGLRGTGSALRSRPGNGRPRHDRPDRPGGAAARGRRPKVKPPTYRGHQKPKGLTAEDSGVHELVPAGISVSATSMPTPSRTNPPGADRRTPAGSRPAHGSQRTACRYV